MQDVVARDVAALRERGFVLIPGLLPSDVLAEVRRALEPDLRADLLGRNEFEGYKTARVYSLVGRAKVFEDLVEHARILAICDAFLEQNYLLTASQAINIHPGETPQAFHTDDSFYRIARPRRAVSISTIFAIDPFTDENGATQIVPGSHEWPDDQFGRLLYEIDFTTAPEGARTPTPEAPLPASLRGKVEDVTMPPGSVIVFLGTLIHRGGGNRSARPRLALSNQYCEPWARQQENFLLSVPRVRARAMSPRVQQLLGYSIHPPFMGHVNGLHPRRLLED
jgi:ectoine hydroxylase-related dioxygenase (phytanoyl-CoA dioxygenase family)